MEEQIQFLCSYEGCEQHKPYKDKGGLSNHYKRNHANMKPHRKSRKLKGVGGFPCDKCQKEYSDV